MPPNSPVNITLKGSSSHCLELSATSVVLAANSTAKHRVQAQARCAGDFEVSLQVASADPRFGNGTIPGVTVLYVRNLPLVTVIVVIGWIYFAAWCVVYLVLGTLLLCILKTFSLPPPPPHTHMAGRYRFIRR